jgi:hypothetical protein
VRGGGFGHVRPTFLYSESTIRVSAEIEVLVNELAADLRSVNEELRKTG